MTRWGALRILDFPDSLLPTITDNGDTLNLPVSMTGLSICMQKEARFIGRSRYQVGCLPAQSGLGEDVFQTHSRQHLVEDGDVRVAKGEPIKNVVVRCHDIEESVVAIAVEYDLAVTGRLDRDGPFARALQRE